MLAVDTQSLYSAPQETASIGNKAAGNSEVLLTSDKAVVTFVGVRWDGDKVRGIRNQLSDGSFKQAGGYDDAKYTLTPYNFAAGETLVSARAARFWIRIWKPAPSRVRNVPEEDFQRWGGWLRP